MSHGGYLNAIYFFDSKFKVFGKYIFSKSKIREVKFNTEETCLTVVETDSYDGLDDDFFIFTLSAKLIVKGNFFKITKIKSSNSLDLYVNKDITLYALNRKDCLIFDNKGNNISVINGGVNSLGFMFNTDLVMLNKLAKLQILQLSSSKILYSSETTIPNLYIENNKFIFKTNENKTYNYEITKN